MCEGTITGDYESSECAWSMCAMISIQSLLY